MTGMKKVVMVIGCMAVLGGCANLYQVDLEKQRQDNMKQDMELLQARETMSFPDPLTLADVIRVGLENNLDMRISKIMGEIADDMSLAEKLKMLPQLNAEGNYSHNSEYNIKEYKDLKTGNVFLGNSISEEKTRKTISAGLSWNVLDFGLSYIRARQAAVGTEIQKMERLRQAQKLAMDISAAYWKTSLAEKNLEYIEKMRQEISGYKAKADEMLQEKRLDPITVRSIEKNMVDLSIAANKLKSDISGTRIELCRLMGLTPLTRFELAKEDSFQAYMANLPKADLIDPAKLEDIALRNRPELFSADMQEAIQQDEARAVLVSMFPGISFNATWFYDDNTYMLNNDWTNVGVSLAANLLSLPAKYQEWKAKDKSVTMVKIQRLMLTAGIIAQVHMSLHDYKVKEEQFSLYDNSLGISDSLLDMTRERSKAGTKGYSDTVVTQNMLETLLTRLERDRSLVDMLNSYNMLLVTLGLDHGRWREPLISDAAQEKNAEVSDAQSSGDTAVSAASPAADAEIPQRETAESPVSDAEIPLSENGIVESGYVSMVPENPDFADFIAARSHGEDFER